MTAVHQLTILLIGENPKGIKEAREVVATLNHTLSTTSSLENACTLLATTEVAVVLLDIDALQTEILSTIQLIRCSNQAPYLPILCLTDTSDREFPKEFFFLDYVELISKKYLQRTLLTQIKTYIELYLMKTAEKKRINESSSDEGKILKEEEGGEDRFQLVMENVSDHALITLNLTGIITDWNAGAERLFGYEAEEIIGQSATILFTSEDRENGRFQEEITLCQAQGQAADDGWHLRKNGTRFFASGTMEALRHSDGTLAGYVKVLRDQTVEKRTKALIDGQKQALELAVSGAPLLSILEVLARTAEVLSPSGVLASILLLDEEGKFLRHGSGPSLPESYNRAVDGVAIGPAVGSCGTAAFINREVIVADIASSPLWKEYKEVALGHGLKSCWSTPIRTSAGIVLGTFALYYREIREPDPNDLEVVILLLNTAAIILERHREVKERQRAKEQLQASEGRFRAIVSQATAGVSQTDFNGRFIFVNPRYCQIVGYSEEQLLQMRMQDITHPDDLSFNLEQFQKLVSGGPNFVIEKRYIRADSSEVWVSNSVTAEKGSQGTIDSIIAVTLDITDRKRNEQRNVFFAELAAATQPLTDPEQVTSVTAQMLAEHLQVDRCAYAEIEDEAIFEITGDYTRGVPSIVGRWPVASFGVECTRLLLNNEPYIVTDTDVDPRINSEDIRAYRAATIRAVICVPLRKEGKFTAAMAVHQAGPRRWTPDEVDLVRTVVARCWEALERARAARRLRASEERFRAAVAATSEILWTNDASGKMIGAQPGWSRFTGQSEEEYRGYGWANSVHPEDANGTIEAWEQAVAERRPFIWEHRVQRHDGVYRQFLIKAVPILEPDGSVREWVGTHTDITDRKRVEERLARVAASSRAIHASLSIDSIARIVTEEARSIIGAHQAVTSLTSGDRWAQAINAVSLSEKYGSYRTFSDKPDGSGIYTEVCRTNQPMRLTQKELELHPAWRAFGKHSAHHPPMRGWLAVPLVGHGGKNLGLIQLSDKYEGEFTAEDEAVLIQLAAISSVGIENARLYESLKDANQRKDEFIALLAHELRNPLAPIRTGLQVLRMTQDPSMRLRTHEMMDRQLTHMVRLIDDLLDVSRVTSGKIVLRPERLDLRTVVEAAVETSRPVIAAAKHHFEVHLPHESLSLEGDKTRLAQVLTNLLNNAAKYTPEGGRIVLSAERMGGEVVIQVADNGLGIPDEMLPKIFEVFTQVGPSIERAQGGLGLGLALVKKLVEMHRGSSWAESPGAGQGSTFFVRLPLVEESAPVEKIFHPTSERIGTESRRVLVVDDNVDGANSLALLLDLEGHEVQLAHSGPEALEKARAYSPEVIFLDIGLPGMNGYEVAQAIRADPALSHCILIALTGWGTEDDQRRAFSCGFNFHMTKPVEPERVYELLTNYNKVPVV